MEEEGSFLAPVKGKVIAAFLLACIAIALAVGTTYLSFNGLLEKVDELSTPNDKLKILNNLFEQISQLDQQQRADAIKNPKKSHQAFLDESKRITAKIDSLLVMSKGDRHQEERFEAMKRILIRRDYLLIKYLKLRSTIVSNKKFSIQLDSLSEILASSKPASDSSVTTTQKKTTTTTYLPETEEKKQSFFGRIFNGKKKEAAPDKRIEVKEEVSVTVDTLAIARQDSAILEVGRIMKTLDKDQRLQTKQMLQRELDLVNTNIILINQLLSILKEVENDEIASIEKKNNEAASLVSSSIERIGIIMIVFFLLAALLVFLILVDISRSNYYRLQLIKAKEEAEELSKVKQRFLANMSHEIRTPLQSIIGFSEQLENPALHAEATHAIRHSSEHLLHIVNELLDFSRIESDTFTINQSPFDLIQLINEVAAAMRIHAEKKGLGFKVSADGCTKLILMGDAFRLRQILYNLLGNAVKFTHEGVVKLETEITEGDFVKCIFRISDTGIGIASKDVERVFGQFEQANTDTHHQYGGAGLGLSIVKKLVDLQQGKIDVQSEQGKGTTFSITLNFEKANLDEAPATIIASPDTSEVFEGKVILVDDDPLILRLSSIILENHHIPFKAIQQAEKVLDENLDNVTFIFLDIRMPGINGIELCKILRKKKSKAKVIALTAHVLPQEQSSILESGFDTILTKPFREIDLLKTLGVDTTPVTDGKSIMDLSGLKKMTMGDEQLLQSVITQFIEETEANLDDLEKKISENNQEAAREIVHKLAGRVGQLGASSLSQALHLIETEFENKKSIIELNEALNSALAELKKLLIEVKKEIAIASK